MIPALPLALLLVPVAFLVGQAAPPADHDARVYENRYFLVGLGLLYLCEKGWSAYHAARKQALTDYAGTDRARAEKAEAALEESRRAMETLKETYEAAVKEERCNCQAKVDQLEESTRARLAYKLGEITTLHEGLKRKDDMIRSQEQIIKDLTVQSQTLSEVMARQAEELSQIRQLTTSNSRQIKATRREVAKATGSASKDAMPVFKAEEVTVEGQKVEVEVKPEGPEPGPGKKKP